VVWPGNEKSKGKIGKVGENSVGVKGRDRSRARERDRERWLKDGVLHSFGRPLQFN